MHTRLRPGAQGYAPRTQTVGHQATPRGRTQGHAPRAPNGLSPTSFGRSAKPPILVPCQTHRPPPQGVGVWRRPSAARRDPKSEKRTTEHPGAGPMRGNLNILRRIEGPPGRPKRRKSSKKQRTNAPRTPGGTQRAANINILQPIEGRPGAPGANAEQGSCRPGRGGRRPEGTDGWTPGYAPKVYAGLRPEGGAACPFQKRGLPLVWDMFEAIFSLASVRAQLLLRFLSKRRFPPAAEDKGEQK